MRRPYLGGWVGGWGAYGAVWCVGGVWDVPCVCVGCAGVRMRLRWRGARLLGVCDEAGIGGKTGAKRPMLDGLLVDLDCMGLEGWSGACVRLPVAWIPEGVAQSPAHPTQRSKQCEPPRLEACKDTGVSYLVHIACGIISPKSSTAVTEMSTAITGVASLSMNRGSAVIATALPSKSETSK